MQMPHTSTEPIKNDRSKSHGRIELVRNCFSSRTPMLQPCPSRTPCQERSVALAIALVAAVALCSGCEFFRGPLVPKSVDGVPVYRVGTKEYEERVRQLRLSLDEARMVIINDFRSRHPESTYLVIGDHYILVGDEYVFSAPTKLDISAYGVYVNGNTGELRDVSNPVVEY